MKIIIALLLAASLTACGSKAKKDTAPPNPTGTETKTEGTGGATYGTPAAAPAPATGTEPSTGQ